MNTELMAKLLAGVLDGQIESGTYGEISEDRLKQAMTSGPDFTLEEQRLFMLSPLARADRARMKKKLLKEMNIRLEQQEVEKELIPLAAATEADSVVLRGNGFSVTLYRQENTHVTWVILLQLENNYRRAINTMTSLRLTDSGGLEWLRGRPDSNGEITASWDDVETDLLERARRFTLLLEPV